MELAHCVCADQIHHTYNTLTQTIEVMCNGLDLLGEIEVMCNGVDPIFGFVYGPVLRVPYMQVIAYKPTSL